MQQTAWRADPLTERLTEDRLRITALEVRVAKIEHERNTGATASKPEAPKAGVTTRIKEWQPFILSLMALAGVLLGKLTWMEAIGLLKGGP